MNSFLVNCNVFLSKKSRNLYAQDNNLLGLKVRWYPHGPGCTNASHHWGPTAWTSLQKHAENHQGSLSQCSSNLTVKYSLYTNLNRLVFPCCCCSFTSSHILHTFCMNISFRPLVISVEMAFQNMAYDKQLKLMFNKNNLSYLWQNYARIVPS